MENLHDLVADDLRRWDERNTADTMIYTPEERATTQYQSNQLKELKKIYLKYYALKENRGDIALKNLKNKLDLMESKVFKNLFSRIWERIKDSVQFSGFVKSIQVKNEQDYDQVRSFLSQTNPDQDFTPRMIFGAKEIKVPNNDYYQMSPTEIMNSSFNLTRSEDDFNTTSYKVRILSTVDPSNLNEVKFSHKSHQWLNREQVYNLASGRPVLHVDHKGNKRWFKLNPLDKDKDGNTQLMQVSAKDFNIREAFEKSMLNGRFTEDKVAEVVNNLNNGNKVNVALMDNGKPTVFSVQADPLGKTLIVSQNKGITMTRKGESNSPQLKVVHKDQMQSRQPTVGSKVKNTTGTDRKPKMKIVKR